MAAINLLMGVSGIRGIVGESMTPQLAVSAGAGFGTHVGPGLVVVGRDSRQSGPMLHSGVIAGLMAVGCDVMDLGIVTTPGAAIMVRHHRAKGGVIITASHNPSPWNGFKFLLAAGRAPAPKEAEPILDILKIGTMNWVPTETMGKLHVDDATAEIHVNHVLETVDVEAIRARRFKVVLDSVHGSGGASGRALLGALDCEVTALYSEPTGVFPHPPEPTRDNLRSLCQSVSEARADVGFAQDPDADRLAIVDETGRYIGEEYTLGLVVQQILSQRTGPVAVNLSTSRMINDIAAAAQVELIRTPTGEANVVEAMIAHKCVVGGEGNGGVIDPRVGWVRDSLVAIAQTLQLMAHHKEPLSAVVDQIPRYSIHKEKFECDALRAEALVASAKKAFTDGTLDDRDGLRVDWPDRWVQVRRSNTEPIVRVIAEAPTPDEAAELVRRVMHLA